MTRDAELPNNKPVEEAEPAAVLPLTPPKADLSRVANDPRERRRLAKQAAEQAHVQAKQAQAAEQAQADAPQTAEVVAQSATTDAPVADAAQETPATVSAEAVPTTEQATDAAADPAPVASEDQAADAVQASLPEIEQATPVKRNRPKPKQTKHRLRRLKILPMQIRTNRPALVVHVVAHRRKPPLVPNDLHNCRSLKET